MASATRIIYLVTIAALVLIAALSLAIYRSAERDAVAAYSSQQLAVTGAVASAIQSEIDALSERLRLFGTLPSVQMPSVEYVGGRVNAAFGRDRRGLVTEVARVDATGHAYHWSTDGRLIVNGAVTRVDADMRARVADRAHEGDVLLAPVWWQETAPAHLRALVTPVWRTASSLEIPTPPNDFNGILALVIDVRRLAELYLGRASTDLIEDRQLMEMGRGGPAVVVGATGGRFVTGISTHVDDQAAGTTVIDGPIGRRVHSWSRFIAADHTWLVETSAPYERITARVRRSAFGQLYLTLALFLAVTLAAWLLVRRERRAEEERGALRLQLAHAQKMEAIGRLAGGVAHDFNNMLTAILGYATLILEEAPPASSIHEHADQIRRASESASGLTHKLLAFGRRQVLQAEPLDLGAMFESLLSLVGRVIGERIVIASDAQPGLWPVVADPVQVEQSLVNLAINARDAMPEGGTLHVHVRNHPCPEGELRDGYVVLPGDYVQVVVRDTGVGMDETTRKRMFEPFFTTKPKGKGTGLGLSSVYGFVKQSGGYINVTSAPGAGTTIELLLPRAPAGRTPKVEAVFPAAAVSPVRTGSATILVVEDEDAVRALAVSLLERQGYRVIQAANAGGALRVVERDRERIDLLLTDVVMPGMQGPELARLLRLEYPTLPVVFMSGYAAEELTDEMRRDAVLLPKPFSSATLLDAVGGALDRRSGDPDVIG